MSIKNSRPVPAEPMLPGTGPGAPATALSV